MARTFASLSRRLRRTSRRLTVNIERTVADVMGEIGERLVPATPVLTGFARGNWRPTVNAPSPVPVSALDPTGAATVARIHAVARQFRVGDTLYLVNRAPYIGELNQGSSPQASAGFVQREVRAAASIALERARLRGLLR